MIPWNRILMLPWNDTFPRLVVRGFLLELGSSIGIAVNEPSRLRLAVWLSNSRFTTG